MYVPVAQDPNRVTVVTSEQFEAMIARLMADPVVALDFETSGLSWWTHARPVGLAAAVFDGDQVLSWYVPWGHETLEPQLDFARIAPPLKALWESTHQTKVLHNSKFDDHMGRTLGWRLQGPRYDTMLAARLFDENRSAALKGRAVTDLGFAWAKDAAEHLDKVVKGIARRAGLPFTEYMKRHGYAQVPLHIAGPYACLDAEFTLRLWAKYENWGVSRRFPRVWANEVQLTEVLVDMEENGLPVDLPYLYWLKDAVGADKRRLQDEIAAALVSQGAPVFDLGSDDQLLSYMQRNLGLSLKHTTNKGNWSVDREVLEYWKDASPVLPLILQWREAEKTDSTYTTNLLDFVDASGVLHPNFQQAGTNTGRLSCRQPNFQNIPADGGKPRSVRRMFVTRKGMVRLYHDYSQIELRVLAYFSQDPILLEAYATGQDVHYRTQMEVFNDPGKERRRHAKVINFGLSYCMSYIGFARNAKIPEDEAKAYLEKFFKRYAGIASFRERFWATVRSNGCIFHNPWGRPRRVPLLNSPDAWVKNRAQRQCIGSLIQGTAAELTRESLVRIWRWIKETGAQAWLVNTVHDEIQTDVVFSEMAKTARAKKQMMEAFDELAPTPVIVDGEYAVTSWAEKKDLPPMEV